MFWFGVLALGVIAAVLVYHALQPAEHPDDAESILTRVDTIHPEGERNHLHGIGFDAQRDRLFLATHYGLFVLGNATGAAAELSRVGDVGHDFMGFQIHPQDGDILFASGHPVGGGNLGLMRSDDAGQTWSLVAAGIGDETVDFHAMSVSAADADIVAGWYRGSIYLSEDGGAAWRTVPGIRGGNCWGAACIALDSGQRDVVYYADHTRPNPGLDALYVSLDLGANWSVLAPGTHAGLYSHPADGSLWAWHGETGAVRYGAPLDANATAEPRSTGLAPGDAGLVFQWSGDPARAEVLFAATVSAQTGVTEVFRTLDGGGNWQRIFTA